jgi:hypothetical protein
VPINISFDTNTITDDEVRGIFALLDTVRPAAFDPGPFDAEEVTRAVEEKLSGAGISVKRDENGNTVTTISAGQFVLPKTEGEPFTMEGAPTPPDADANGLPWDERIHSGTKALNADGTWRTKRGVDKAFVAEVEAELCNQTVVVESAEDNEKVAEITGVQDAQTVAAPPAPDIPAVTVTVPTPPPSAPVPPPPPAPTDTGVPSFPDAVKICSALGKETYTKLFAEVGLKSVMEMRDDAALRERFFGHESVIVARMEKGV